MTRIVAALMVFLTGSLIFNSTKASTDHYVGSVPREIRQLMSQKGCSPIERFYDREVISPPFVYGMNWPDGPPLLFFACQLDLPVTRDRFKIVVMKRDRSAHGSGYSDFRDCANEIFFRSMPGGLNLTLNEELREQFLLLDPNLYEDSKNNVWNSRRAKITVGEKAPSWVLEERQEGGVGYGLFCTDGDWYNVSYD